MKELYLSVRFVSTQEIKLYMLLPISTAVTVHCLLRSALPSEEPAIYVVRRIERGRRYGEEEKGSELKWA